MKSLLLITACALYLIFSTCCARAVNEEESVVSVYTNPSSGGDVYGQIATNIAEKITSPFYRFFGLNSTDHTTKRPFEHIELQETNTTERDVEELSEEALQKTEKKPEKVTLFSNYLPANSEKPEKVTIFSNYLPANGKLETLNEMKNEVDDDFDDDFGPDDVEEAVSPKGPFVFVLELLGSVIQLLWGGFLAIFKPQRSK